MLTFFRAILRRRQLSLARLDRHLRRARHRAADVEERALARQFKGGGLRRQAEGGVLRGRGWDAACTGEFMEMLDGYLAWYRDKRRKSDLGYKSPMRYRRKLGLAA